MTVDGGQPGSSSIPPDVLRVAMVLYGDLTFDSRVQREANSLVKAGHAVTVFCLEGSHAASPMLDRRVTVEIVPPRGASRSARAPSPFLAGSGRGRIAARLGWLSAYVRNLGSWARAVRRTASAFDVWHAHDFTGLVAADLARPSGTVLVYDLHDIFLETGTGARLPRVLRWLVRRYERRLVGHIDLVVTVNGALAAYYTEHFHPRSMIVVHNCVPAWQPPDPRPTLIRDALDLDPAIPVILYHGLLDQDRGLETLYKAMLESGLENAHLVLLGPGQRRERLRDLAAEPRFDGRIHVLDPVTPANLLPWVASADIGAMAMPPTTLNLYLSTPNKLFECLAAGVPVVISDFPAVRKIVLDDPLGPLGVACAPTSARDVARALRELLDLDTAARTELGRRCAAAARERWNWESEARSLLEGYAQVARARRSPDGG